MPLPKKARKIHDEGGSGLRLPAAAAARMTAIGPEAEKIKATSPSPSSQGPRARRISRKVGRGKCGFSTASKDDVPMRVRLLIFLNKMALNPKWHRSTPPRADFPSSTLTCHIVPHITEWSAKIPLLKSRSVR